MDGLSFETAIELEVATREEYHYITSLYGPMGVFWDLKIQSLIHQGDKHYDILEIELKDGKTMSYYFDITKVFGRKLPFPLGN